MVKQLPLKQLTMVRFHVGAQKIETSCSHVFIFCAPWNRTGKGSVRCTSDRGGAHKPLGL